MKKRTRKKPSAQATKKRFCAKTFVDLYKINLHLVVSPDTYDARRAAKQFLGDDRDYDFGAKCTWRDCNFALLFRRDYMEHSVIAHEVFHVVHFIMQHVGGKYSRKSSEAYCYLAEWITAWVYRQLKKAKIRVSI